MDPETETTSSRLATNCGDRPNIELIASPRPPITCWKATAARRQAGPALDRLEADFTELTGK